MGDTRFKLKGNQSLYNLGATIPEVGPGSYQTTENLLIKKSYNMSVEHSYFV